MTKKEFMIEWLSLDKDKETEDYIPSDDDLFVRIGGYLFAVQKDGNVIMKKSERSLFSIHEVFRAFRIWAKSQRVQYIRVEGTKNRYNFLKKMFPNLSILKDEEIKDRNVFYIKVYD